MVDGDLYIENNIHVLPGYTALFSVSGDIHVAASVGYENETTYPDSSGTVNTNLEGWYSTDKSFIVEGLSGESGANKCPTTDKRLNVAGAIVVNAALGGGSFDNTQRDLCDKDLTCPVFYIQERPDFTLNAETSQHPYAI